MGLIDQTCPPAGVFAAWNQINAPKEIVILPLGGHADSKHAHAAYQTRWTAWLAALRQGQPAPVKP